MLSRLAALTVLPLAAVAFAGGCAASGSVSVTGEASQPSSSARPSASASATAKAGGDASTGKGDSVGGDTAIFEGKRLAYIVVNDGTGARLAVGHDDDDRILSTTESDVTGRGTWIVKSVGGGGYQFVLGSLHGDSKMCMQEMHSGGNGTVKVRVCDDGVTDQIFQIADQENGSYLVSGDRSDVQVVDGASEDILVPDLREGPTTTFKFKDAGAPDKVFLS